MLHHTKSCQQVLPLGSAPAALALRCVCSSVPPPCKGQAPAGLSHTAGTSLHKWLLLFLGSHSQSPVWSCSQGQSQPLLGSNGHNPRHQTLHPQLAQRGCSPAGHSGKPRVPLKRTLCPSRQEQDDAQKSRGHCGWGQQGSCLFWVPHTGSSQEQEMCAPQRHWVLHPGQPRDTCPEDRETLEQLQAQRNTPSV